MLHKKTIVIVGETQSAFGRTELKINIYTNWNSTQYTLVSYLIEKKENFRETNEKVSWSGALKVEGLDAL